VTTAPPAVRTVHGPHLAPGSSASGDRVARGVPPIVVLSLLAFAAVLLPAARAGAVGSATATLTSGRPAPDTYDALDGEVSPAAMLTMAVNAARVATYSGRQRVTVLDGGTSRSMVIEVRHAPGTGSIVKVPAAAGGGTTEYYQPDVLLAGSIVPLDARVIALLTANYTPVMGGVAMVAGRRTEVVQLRDGQGHLAAALWLDAVTCLPLRRVVYDGAGQVVRSSEFSSLHLDGTDVVDDSAPGREEALTPSGRPLSAPEVHRLGESGWVTPSALPRGLDLVDGRLTGAGQSEVLHLTYSDGLSTLSVFEQAGRLDTARLAGWRKERRGGAEVWTWPGAPLSVTWSSHGRVFSVVSDDADRLGEVVAQLPHGSTHPSVLSRLKSGTHRLLSWLNPFG
jgi:sigma-E factor negative regulatory protein RseB